MDHITTIIVHFNTDVETKACLLSLNKLNDSDNFKHQIIVIDNGSKEKFTIPSSLKKMNIKLVRSEKNLGFTGGNNLGISEAVKEFNTDYIFLLNSDTEIEANCLNVLYKAINEDEDTGIVCPKIYFAPSYEYHLKNYLRSEIGKIIWYAGGAIDWNNLVCFHPGVDEVDRGQFDQLHKTEFATGCAMLIKRELIEEVGILDKKYYLYLEDADYSLRTRKAGYNIIFSPKAIVWHKNAGSSDGVGSIIQQYYQTRNKYLFFNKYGKFKVKLTIIRVLIQVLITGNEIEKKATFDYLLHKFGKRTIL